jgi:hypothetical protein
LLRAQSCSNGNVQKTETNCPCQDFYFKWHTPSPSYLLLIDRGGY